MSRYDEDGEASMPAELWEANLRRALSGRRGRRALAELREALMALPEHRLIGGAMCTVSAAKRREALAAEDVRRWEQTPAQWRPDKPRLDGADDLDALMETEGEGCCAIGALLWHQKVRAGVDPVEAFDSLPLLLGDSDEGGLYRTAELGRDAGLTMTLAWHIAYRNDEEFEHMTPEQRWSAFVTWIDAELAADQAVKAGA